ncbi:NEDD8-activating enzyme E1 catalytic subunit [Nakaseomyces bracarensis]|uniref:NEDD8-activating enzyme E1 catalytic subunit n=1 Tax=Nakaseomyces bracarensis TaxID=273131 RepID=A0ABR4NMG7_9SACH
MSCKVLVLGAGGLGCEILSSLIHYEFINEIHVIDMDTIQLSNLNRQFLFRENDIGKYKADIAAKAILEMIVGQQKKVVPYVCDLTTLDAQFFSQFQFVISGLDAIAPRRYTNQILVNLTLQSNYEICIPFIDGGVEGLKGHVKTIVPGFTACWECSIDTLPSEEASNHPMCTVANNPRSIEHIVEYVLMISNPDADLDDYQVCENLLRECQQRAIEYNIDSSTLDIKSMAAIAKKVIPSVSTTNAIIASMCCNQLMCIYEDLWDPESSSNFSTVNGSSGFYIYSFQYDRNPKCTVCSI